MASYFAEDLGGRYPGCSDLRVFRSGVRRIPQRATPFLPFMCCYIGPYVTRPCELLICDLDQLRLTTCPMHRYSSICLCIRGPRRSCVCVHTTYVCNIASNKPFVSILVVVGYEPSSSRQNGVTRDTCVGNYLVRPGLGY